MKGYIHTRSYQLRYSDYDFKDELKFSSLLELVQESACLSAAELGFGYDDLRPRGFGFLTVNTYCEFIRPVALNEELRVQTWPLPPRHAICERDYYVFNRNWEKVANLASRWCLVDLKSFSLLSPEAMGEAHEKCPYRPDHSVIVPSWKIKRIEGREAFSMTVGSSRCDHYFHANNCYYADFFLDCFTMEELKVPVKSFQIAYVKQAKEGTSLRFFRADEEGESILEARANDELIAQFRLVFAKTQK